jgi:hypothetical protein
VPRRFDKLFLVEDHDHLAVTTGLIGHYVNLGTEETGFKVEIRIRRSAAEVLKPISLDTFCKTPGLKSIGVMVDADDEFLSRWSGIESFARGRFDPVPNQLPTEGLVLTRGDGFKFGAWIMPNNRSAGKVETFCHTLVDQSATSSLWDHAVRSCSVAREVHRAPWRDAHKDRAEILTWLAWQDPPLGQMGAAIRSNVLNPRTDAASVFVSWFRRLFEV